MDVLRLVLLPAPSIAAAAVLVPAAGDARPGGVVVRAPADVGAGAPVRGCLRLPLRDG